MEYIKDVPQVWWEITCRYDGHPESWGMAAGNTAEEAIANYLKFLAEPQKATITSVVPIGNCTCVEALSGGLPPDA
jgi:hypothetical protein